MILKIYIGNIKFIIYYMKEYILCIILGIILYFIIQDSINKFSIGITAWYETYKDGTTRYYYNRKVRRQDIEKRIGGFNTFEDDPNILNYGEGFLPAEEQLIEYLGRGRLAVPREVDYEGNTYQFLPRIQHERVEFPNLVYTWDGDRVMVQQPQQQLRQRSWWQRLCSTTRS
jgi:hypothetical protein